MATEGEQSKLKQFSQDDCSGVDWQPASKAKGQKELMASASRPLSHDTVTALHSDPNTQSQSFPKVRLASINLCVLNLLLVIVFNAATLPQLPRSPARPHAEHVGSCVPRPYIQQGVEATT